MAIELPYVVPDVPAGMVKQIDVTKRGLARLEINREVAEYLISTYNTDNRPRRHNQVNYLAMQMIDGTWRDDSPDLLLFSRDGKSISMQHRLYAVIEADKVKPGIAVWMRCEFGADPAVKAVTDTQVGRTHADNVKYVDASHRDNRRAHALTKAFHWKCSGRSRLRATPREMDEQFERHREAILWMVANWPNHGGIMRMPLALAFCEFYELDQEQATRFLKSYCDKLGDIDQARILREYIIRQHGFTGCHRLDSEIYEKAVSAMCYYVEGRQIQRLTRRGWDSLQRRVLV